MDRVLSFDPQFAASFPETYALMLSANLAVHPGVSRVILHGSRGPKGGYRPDSDVDLSLIVDALQDPDGERELLVCIKPSRDFMVWLRMRGFA